MNTLSLSPDYKCKSNLEVFLPEIDGIIRSVYPNGYLENRKDNTEHDAKEYFQGFLCIRNEGIIVHGIYRFFSIKKEEKTTLLWLYEKWPMDTGTTIYSS